MLQAVIDEMTASHGVTLIAFPTAADGGMVPGFAHSIWSTAAPHYAWVNTLVVAADPTGWTVLMFEAVSLDAALPLVQWIPDKSIQALADGAMLV